MFQDDPFRKLSHIPDKRLNILSFTSFFSTHSNHSEDISDVIIILLNNATLFKSPQKTYLQIFTHFTIVD